MNKSKKKINNKTKWYPVSTFGWFVTIIYTALLTYIVTQIHIKFDTIEAVFLKGAMTMVVILVGILIYAYMSDEQPFKKN